MTKDEFITSFNELISTNEPDALKIEEFRNNVISDYEALATAQTAVSSFKATNENLTEANKKLQETNMKLIMLHPESIKISSETPTTDSTTDEPYEPSEEEKSKALSEVLEGFGHKTT